MAYVLESNPELISPEYWGVNIADSIAFDKIGTSEFVRNSSSGHTAALLSLGRVLGAAELGLKLIETPTVSNEHTPQIDLDDADYPQGTVFIVRSEYITKHSTVDGHPATPVTLKGNLVTELDEPKAPPIMYPYSTYWQRLQEIREPKSLTSHEQRAVFENEGMCYGDFLTWGVTTTSLTDKRVMSLLGFDFQGPGQFLLNVWVKAHARPRIGKLLPIDISTPLKQSYISSGNSRGLEIGQYAYALTSRAGHIAYPVGDKDASGCQYRDRLTFDGCSVVKALVRTTDIRQVQVASLPKHLRVPFSERARKFSSSLGNALLPNPLPNIS